jgi:hypothetical protein
MGPRAIEPCERHRDVGRRDSSLHELVVARMTQVQVQRERRARVEVGLRAHRGVA